MSVWVFEDAEHASFPLWRYKKKLYGALTKANSVKIQWSSCTASVQWGSRHTKIEVTHLAWTLRHCPVMCGLSQDKYHVASKIDACSMPRADELLDQSSKTCFYSRLYLTKGNWQIPLSECNEKTAFSCLCRLYQFIMLLWTAPSWLIFCCLRRWHHNL